MLKTLAYLLKDAASIAEGVGGDDPKLIKTLLVNRINEVTLIIGEHFTNNHSVVLVSYGGSKIGAIKAIREAIPGMTLKAANDLVSAAPAAIVSDLTVSEANSFCERISRYLPSDVAVRVEKY